MSRINISQFTCTEIEDSQSASVVGGYSYNDTYISYTNKFNKITVAPYQLVATKNIQTAVNAGKGTAKNTARTSGKNGFGNININIDSYDSYYYY